MIELFVPGRLCLFGEHSDWAGGYRRVDPSIPPGQCLVAGTDQGIHVEAEARLREVAIAHWIDSERRWHEEVVDDMAGFLAEKAEAGGFLSYAFGTAAQVIASHKVGGITLRIRSSTLPIQKGLSSSAAICVAVARAFSRVHDLGLTEDQEMELAYEGERLAGSECGRMDQICAYGRRATHLTFDGDRLTIETLDVAKPLHLLIVDLARSKDTRRILRDLNACFPAAPGVVAAGVREALGPLNERLVSRAREALVVGDAAALGALMTEAQALFDRQVAPACPELAAPRLHEVLDHPAARELALGGKGVGSQGDGSAQLVTAGPAERDALANRLERELGVPCLPLTLEPADRTHASG
ncbi:MAG: GHMP kinase [Deltaproteobacteria bacterium]|nr:GHMP kinase [Deltaproteobacteria bacterium]